MSCVFAQDGGEEDRSIPFCSWRLRPSCGTAAGVVVQRSGGWGQELGAGGLVIVQAGGSSDAGGPTASTVNRTERR